MSLSKENLSFFLICFSIILLILVPYSDQILQDERSHPILPSAIDQKKPNPEKRRDDSHAQRWKTTSQQKPEKSVSGAEMERDKVLELYHEIDETVAEINQDRARRPAVVDTSDSNKEGLQHGRGVDQGVGDTYMTVVGDGDDLEIVTVIPPLLNELNSLDNVDGTEGSIELENEIRKNTESHQKRKAQIRSHHKEKHRNKNHKQLLHTKELLLHPHSIQMKDALEHFKSVMQRLGNMTDLFHRFLPSREVNKKTHSFIKKLRKLKKVVRSKGKGSRLKRHARPHPLPLSHHSVQYLKTIGFTQDDLRFYGLKDDDIFHPAGTGKDEVLTFKGTFTEELKKQGKGTADMLKRVKRASDLRQLKRSVSQTLSRSKRSVSERKRASEPVKSVGSSVEKEANPEVEHVQLVAKSRSGEILISEKETGDVKNTDESSANAADVSEIKTIEETASKTSQDSVVEDTNIGSKGVENDNEVKLAESGKSVSPLPIVNPSKVVLKNVDLKENSPDTSTAYVSPSSDVQLTSASAHLVSHEAADVDTGKVDLKSGSRGYNSDTKTSSIPIAHSKMALNSGSSSDQVIPNDSSKREGSPLNSVESRKTDLKSSKPVDPAAVVPDDTVVDVIAADDASDCNNDTDCAADGRNSNYIVNIAFIRTIMNDRSKDALYGILSLGLIVGTVLVAVLYTQMWRTKREGWFTPKDQHHSNTNSSQVKIREVLRSKARYLPMFHQKWKKGKKYEPLKQEDISESSEEEIYDQRRLMHVNSYED
ncbi:uncharacterized protein LOC135482828 [Lineus longissimus]|uniref:uncharacterized protein LOC135482828 n=1 Tax=Lineus longissimus TaxID=88925 RepID=UPI00315D7498